MKKLLFYVLALSTLLLYYLMSYHLDRAAYPWLITGYSLLFVQYIVLLNQLYKYRELWRDGLFLLLAVRLVHLVHIPNLSDDYFRYIWDGRLWLIGESAYAELPSLSKKWPELYLGLNSKEYYSIYPPVAQLFFTFATSFTDSIQGTITILRSTFIGLDLLSCWAIYLLAQKRGWGREQVFIYALNPLVILEFTANIHLEGILVFGILWMLYFLEQKSYFRAAFFGALAVMAKLLPLFFMPYLFFRLKGRGRLIFFGSLAFFCLLFAWPLFSVDLLQNFLTSCQLYFKAFEFNASIYYLLRWGILEEHYDWVLILRKVLPLVTMGCIIGGSYYMAKQRVYVLTAFLLIYSCYYAFATTVHPWYLIPLVAFSAGTSSFRFALLWSALIPLTYFCYWDNAYQESFTLITLEYVLVYGLFFHEIKRKTTKLVPFS